MFPKGYKMKLGREITPPKRVRPGTYFPSIFHNNRPIPLTKFKRHEMQIHLPCPKDPNLQTNAASRQTKQQLRATRCSIKITNHQMNNKSMRREDAVFSCPPISQTIPRKASVIQSPLGSKSSTWCASVSAQLRALPWRTNSTPGGERTCEIGTCCNSKEEPQAYKSRTCTTIFGDVRGQI